ncbi:MAG: restriction endonuclease subunit S [Fibrobacter sp.]|nr:restriction endonuclease subunit S [Fibrobacter sp.]
MTPEIEKRIKLVQAGKVPAGKILDERGETRDERKELLPKLNVWPKVKLEDIFDEVCEKNHPEADVLTIIQGVGTVLRSESGREIIYDKDSLASYKYVRKGDFIIHLRSFEGGLEMANQNGIVSPAYIILHPKVPVSSIYLYALFHSNKFINQTMAPAVEGARDGRSVKYEVLKKQKILFPSLPEQEKIAEILAAQDRVIELKEKLVAEKKNNKSILLKRLLNDCCFGEQRDNVKIGSVILAQTSWKKQKLGSICEKIGSGSTPKGGRTVYLDRGIPIIRSQNVLNGYLDMSDVAYISDEQHKKMSGTWVRPNDILLNITGASIGRACLVPASVQTANVNQHVCIVRLKEGVNHSYICSLILSDKVQKQIELMSAGGGRQGLNFQQIASFEVPLPSLPEQQAIAKVLSAADEEIALLQKDLEQEKLKKKSLMQLLLTGLVRVSA